MNSLKVPDGGLLLEGASGQDAALPLQAFSFSLSDNVVEQLIRTAQKGEALELQLGNNPVSFSGKQETDPRLFGGKIEQFCPAKALLPSCVYMLLIKGTPSASGSAIRFENARDSKAQRQRPIRTLPHEAIRINEKGRASST